MQIKDLRPSEIIIGLKIKDYITGKNGTIIDINQSEGGWASIQWDGEEDIYDGFYVNQCKNVQYKIIPQEQPKRLD